jgi:hypothetical protein
MRVRLTFIFLILSLFLLIDLKQAFSQPALNLTNITAQGGNTTFLYLGTGIQETVGWQGFFGTVSGGIVLSDSTNNTFYDWNLVRANGEVYATREIVADWSTVNCTNQTEIYNEEERLSITNLSNDGINDTYRNLTHPNFDVSGRVISGCRSTLTNNLTDSNVVFWNILLSSNSTTIIYAGMLDDNVIGFNGTAVDFQLLVPVNRTNSVATYNIYLELS